MRRSKHSLSNYKLFSGKMGRLIPCGLTEVLPGDTVQQATSALVRCNPLVAPVMHPISVRIHHWYVPLRLIWSDFENFITGGPDGLNASVFPTITTPASTGFTEGSLADYLGVTPGVASRAVSALPFRAYAMIFNEWYRDQDLVTALALSKASGADSTTSVALALCAWEKDYFTASRISTQKGPTVSLPLGEEAPIRSRSTTSPHDPTLDDRVYLKDGLNGEAYAMRSKGVGSPTDMEALSDPAGPGGEVMYWQQEDDIPNTSSLAGYNFADLANATAADVNSLRLAMALQRYEEARSRYGSRFTEYLRYLGVRSSDARLQRPEYLGGGKQTIQFSEVLGTAQTLDADEDEVPIGALKGHGIAAMRSNRYRRFFEEHGYIITLMSVRPKTIYAQGLARTWNRRTKEDFWQKELEHIGQQEVQNQEVYMGHSDPTGTFGYIDRYDEYRRSESSVAGSFRSTLNYWHMARIFSGDPELNGSFVTCDPTQRNFVDTEGDTILVMANHSIQARRLVAKVGTSFIY